MPNTTGPSPARQDATRAANPADLSTFDTTPAIDALYLHLPFCFHKCHYCDFYSVVEPQGQSAPRQTAFTDALIAELRRRADQAPIRPATLFAGGGTPTYLRPELWEKLLETLRETGMLAPETGQEFTVEANPETVTPELMRLLASGGVNRVSIGAQSFDRGSLKALERWHDPDSVPRAVQMCRDAGITNFSLDLIFAIPGQTLEMLDNDLDALLALEPNHLSTYGLTYEPNTPLTAKLRVGQIDRADEDLERAMYDLVLTKLEAAGFEHYEISNWARRGSGAREQGTGISECRPDPQHLIPDPSGTKCRHNLAYWHNLNWLGVGPSAASHAAGHRWSNAPNLTRYLQTAPQPPVINHEYLNPADHFGERLMLGLRLREGIDHPWFLTHEQCKPHHRATADELVDLGLLEIVDDRVRLTRKGLFVGDAVIAKLM